MMFIAYYQNQLAEESDIYFVLTNITQSTEKLVSDKRIQTSSKNK